MSTVCQVKASFCCIIGLDVNREIEPVLVYLRWTLVLWMCRTKQRCNLQNWTCGIRSFSWLHLWFWLFINLGAHGPRIMIYWNISLWCSSLLTRWQVLSPAVPIEEEIWTSANSASSTEVLKLQLSNHACSVRVTACWLECWMGTKNINQTLLGTTMASLQHIQALYVMLCDWQVVSLICTWCVGQNIVLPSPFDLYCWHA